MPGKVTPSSVVSQAVRPTESESKILAAVFRAGSMTQPDLVRLTGLSQQSVSRLVSDLMRQGGDPG